MLFYALFLLVITGLLFVKYFYPSKQKELELVVLIIIVIIAGFRKKIGSDYDNYVHWYLSRTRDDNLEFGFVAIMDLFRGLDLRPSFLFFFFSFLTCLFVFIGIKRYTENSNLALLFYILIPGLYLTSFTLIRQSLSVVISFYAFNYLINKKYMHFMAMMLLGISIHNTCLIPFIIFLFVFKYGNKIKINYLYGLIFFSFVLSSFDFIQVFKGLFEDSRYLYYFSAKAKEVNIWKIVVINLEGIFILHYFKNNEDKYSNRQNLVVLYCFSIVILNLFRYNEDLTRIASFFRIFEIILIADIISLEINRKRIILFSFFYIIYLGAFFNALKKDLDNNNNMPKYIPYDNFLWSSSSSIELGFKKNKVVE